jgi:large subunit ribosomal protein L3
MKYIVGTKVGMIRLFETNGKSVPATVIHCEPNVVLENKTKEKNGCSGIKIGYKNTKENKKKRAHNGIFKKLNLPTQHYIRTFTSVDQAYQVSDKINVDTFKVGEYVDVQGVTKGHGFTGAIKR